MGSNQRVVFSQALLEPGHREAQPLGLRGLEDVVDGAPLERLDCVLIKGGHEDNFGWMTIQTKIQLDDLGGRFDARQAGHTDIEKDHVRLQFSDKIDDAHFPRGGAWLMMGPTGPRRLRLAIEHLANVRGSSCYFIDLDPRFVKKLLSNKQYDVAKQYMAHVVDQAATILKHRKVSGLFTTPKLLEALAEQVNLWEAGIRGVFCGGTSMKPQEVRFIVEELLEGRIGFYPTYGNTLMGLAASVPLQPEDNFSVTYYAPQPRAVLRVVKPNATDELVNYGEFGRVELTTLTREFFMPRFLERDETIRRAPRPPYAWDGVGDVRPFGAMEKTIVEGVY